MVLSETERQRLTKSRWVLLVLSCIVNLCIGSMYSWSAFSVPMAAELGVESLSIVFSIATALGFVTMIIGGLLNDKFGPRWVVFAGGVMYGVGMFTSGFAQNVSHLIWSYSICLGLGISLVYCCTINNTIKFFPDKRGLVGGLTTACFGISSVVFPPIIAALDLSVGIRQTFMFIGAFCFVVIIIGSFFMKRCPQDFVPEGYTPPENVASKPAINVSPFGMLKMPIFYVMFFMLTCGATFGMMMISNAKGIALNMVGATPAMATLFVSVLCFFNAGGRILCGALSDKLGRINTLTIALIIALVGLVCLIVAANTVSIAFFAVGVMLVGFCFGTFTGVFPGFCTDQFGHKYNTVNYGLLWIGFSLAGLLGPTILTKVQAATGNYATAFMIAMAIAVVGLILTFVYRAVNSKAYNKAAQEAPAVSE